MNFHPIFLVLIFLFEINVVAAQQSSIKYYQADIPLKIFPKCSVIECYGNKINIYDFNTVDYIGSIEIHKGTFTLEDKNMIARIDTVIGFSAHIPTPTFAQINCEKENLYIRNFQSKKLIIHRDFGAGSKFIDGKRKPIIENLAVLYTAIEFPKNKFEYYRSKNWIAAIPEANFIICD